MSLSNAPPNAPIVFYFDFFSPNAHIGAVAIERLAQRLGRQVEWRPVLIGITILKIMGMRPIRDYPLKGPYLTRDMQRLAEYFQVPLRPHDREGVNSVQASRAFLLLKQQDPALAKRFGQAIFHRLWVEGQDITPAGAVLEVAAAVGADTATLAERLGLDETKDMLRQAVDDAVAAGVFGVPSFIADGELFWGSDHLWMLEHWLTHHRFTP